MITKEEIKAQQKQATKEVWLFILIAFSIVVGGIVVSMILGENLGNFIADRPSVYTTIIWIVFGLFMSTFEALYFTHEINSSFHDKINEHPLFVCIRACVLVPLWILTSWKVVLCLAVMFPFIHDGQYYLFREKLVKGTYPKGWFAQSTTSTALSTKYMTPVVRTILFALSLTGLYFFA